MSANSACLKDIRALSGETTRYYFFSGSEEITVMNPALDGTQREVSIRASPIDRDRTALDITDNDAAGAARNSVIGGIKPEPDTLRVSFLHRSYGCLRFGEGHA